MKKLIVSILLIVYFVSSTGATVQLHYCMDQLVSWDISAKMKNKCSNCGMEKKGHGGCCKDESKFVKNDFDQKVTESMIAGIQFVSSAPVAFINISENCSSSLSEKYPIIHAPPLISGVDILIRNCVFRI